MPELPEVETIVKQLQTVLPGKVVLKIEVRREKSFRGQTDEITGLEIRRVSRKAKMMVLEFVKSEKIALVHLKMTGQLIWCEKRGIKNENERRIVGGHPTEDWINSLPSKHTRVVMKFVDGSTLFFNDMRVFGWIKIISKSQFLIFRQTLPPDVIDPEFTTKYLEGVLKKSGRPVKLVLLDQSNIGGLGNIYVNDALFLAHTKPTRRAKWLKRKEISELHKALIKVIRRGIEVGGASESTYKHINGRGGKYQEEFLIYKRNGQVCGLNGCKGVIEKIKLGGRGTYYCPKCQV